MAKNYEHLSVEERALIQVQLEQGFKLRAIARSLKRHASTLSREFKRNGYKPICALAASPTMLDAPLGYNCQRANQRAIGLTHKPRRKRLLVVGSALWSRVKAGLKDGLSPEQIAHTLKNMKADASGTLGELPPSTPCISHESIYQAIYAMPRGELRAEIVALLRQSRKSRRPRTRGADRRGKIANMVSIEARPEEVTERLVPGHWEGDLIKGARNGSQVGTLVERTTLFTVLAQLDNATAQATSDGFARVLSRIDSQMRLSLTYDQGREMAAHARLTAQTNMAVYFAHPHSPWERGINENTNGLLRQYLPKGSDLSIYTQEQLDDIAWKLNTRPRKSLGWKAPAELFLPNGSFDTIAYWAARLNPVALVT